MTETTDRTIDISILQGSKLSAPFSIPEELSVLADGAKKTQSQGCFRVMTPKDGDKRIVWDTLVLAEINAAKQMFDNLKKEGLRPFRVGTNGQATAEEMKEFDPVMGEVIFLPMPAIRAG